jgi:hypothetical protein
MLCSYDLLLRLAEKKKRAAAQLAMQLICVMQLSACFSDEA